MTHGSLFSGIGGFDLVAEWTGWENVFQCEKDEWCRRVLAKNFPSIKRYADIKDFNAKEYEGKIDIISAGFPCQPFSVAGNRRGEDDDRYLWPETIRIVREIKPSYVVCENVPGIIKLALDTVLSDLENEGYTTETFIIPACAKNAWHRRDRVWVIAYTNCCANRRTSKSLLSPDEKSRLQEREQMEQPLISGKVRISAHTKGIGRERSGDSRKRRTGLENNDSNNEGISANANSERCEEQWKSIKIPATFFAPRFDMWWETEPGMDRVVDGLPNRMDRIKGLGNAIVPQIAYEIFKAINAMQSLPMILPKHLTLL